MENVAPAWPTSVVIVAITKLLPWLTREMPFKASTLVIAWINSVLVSGFSVFSVMDGAVNVAECSTVRPTRLA